MEVEDDNRSADSWILDEGLDEGLYVCTNDMRLKRALKERGKRALSVSENGVFR